MISTKVMVCASIRALLARKKRENAGKAVKKKDWQFRPATI
jgi:hypothetical protein